MISEYLPSHQFQTRNSGRRRSEAYAKGQDFITGRELQKLKEQTKVISTGNNQLDDLLMIPEYRSYGIRLGETYEFYGASRSGKTQLMHQLAVTSQFPRKFGGPDKDMIFIDTEHSFSPARISQIAEAMRVRFNWQRETNEILSRIMITRCNTVNQLDQAVKVIDHLLAADEDRFGLLVVDSIASTFRAAYLGQSHLVERQQAINSLLNQLKNYALTYKIAVIITNQVVAQPEQVFGPALIHSGGHIIGHWATHRLQLRMNRANTRTIKIIDSPVYPEMETVVAITKQGISSVGEFTG